MQQHHRHTIGASLVRVSSSLRIIPSGWRMEAGGACVYVCTCVRVYVCVCMCTRACVCVCVYRDRESFLRVEVDEQMCRVRNGACHASPPTVVAVYCNFSANRESFYISPFSLFFPRTPRFFLLPFAPLFLSIPSRSPMTIPLNVGYAVTVTHHGESSTHIVIRITNVTNRIEREQ